MKIICLYQMKEFKPKKIAFEEKVCKVRIFIKYLEL